MDKMVDPQVKDLPNGIMPREIAIKINTTGVSDCQVWISAYQKGALSPLDLLGIPELDQVFAKAAKEGLAESEQTMLTDPQHKGRHIYLFPKDYFQSSPRALAVTSLVEQIKALKVSRVGLYLGPDLFGPEQAIDLTTAVIRGLCDAAGCDSIYLFKGDFDYNHLLNLSLQLKLGLDSRALILSLYH